MTSWPGIIAVVSLVGAASITGCDDAPYGPEGRVTFASLPQADRDRFERWKDLVIKDCAWEQAFPSLADEFADEPYATQNARVDIRALLAGNAGSPLLAGPDGQLILLAEPARELGFETRALSKRSTIAGRTRVFDISSNRDEGVCVIELDGEELYRARLAATVPVVAATDREALATAGADLPPLVEPVVPAGEPVAAIDGAALLRHALAALSPSPRAHGVLAARFAVTELVARERFPLAAPRAPDVARLVDSPASPFAPHARLYGPRTSLAPLYEGGSAQVELLYSGFGDGLLAVRAELAIAAGGSNVRATAITAAPRVAFSDQATTACFTARGLARQFETGQLRSPSFGEQFTGCDELAADGFAALADDDVIRQTIANRALLLGTAPFTQYRGWDRALIEVAVRLDQQGRALAELDPGGAIAALPAVIAQRDGLRAAIADAAARAAFARPVIELALGWLLDGLAPSPALVTTVEAALANTAAAFSESALAMVADLAERIDAQSPGPLAARCGMELTGARRTALEQMLAAVDEIPFADDFLAQTRATVLQDCPSSDAVTALQTTAATVRDFVVQDQVRASVAALYGFAVEPLIRHALAERWTAETFTAARDLIGFALVSDFTYCDLVVSVAERIDCIDRLLDIFTTTRMLAPGAAARYAGLARDLTARWPGLAGTLYFNARHDISQAVFGSRGLWLACDGAGFARSAGRLGSLLDALRAATTFDQRFALENQIAALVEATTCP